VPDDDNTLYFMLISVGIKEWTSQETEIGA
jgi:hypothetical protein